MARSDRIPRFPSEAARARFLAVYDQALQRCWPVPVEAEDVPVGAGTVRVYRTGPRGNDPYVLLTGAGGNALAWHRWMDRLGDRPVIAVDPLGEPGHSVQTAPVYSREAAAEWVEELLTAVGAERAHLVGVSWGGYLALEHELRHPGRVAAITRVDPAGFGPLPWRFWRWMILCGLAAFTLPARARRRAARWLHNATLADDEVVRLMRAGAGFRRPVTRVPVFTDDELAAIRIPVQILFGGGPSALQATDPERVRAPVPGWRVEVFPDAGHALVMDAEDEVIDRVRTFPAVGPADDAGPELPHSARRA